VTNDEDFAVHQGLHGDPSIVWVRIGNTRRAELLRRFDAGLPEIIAALERGESGSGEWFSAVERQKPRASAISRGVGRDHRERRIASLRGYAEHARWAPPGIVF
jgi:hypothetical protein